MYLRNHFPLKHISGLAWSSFGLQSETRSSNTRGRWKIFTRRQQIKNPFFGSMSSGGLLPDRLCLPPPTKLILSDIVAKHLTGMSVSSKSNTAKLVRSKAILSLEPGVMTQVLAVRKCEVGPSCGAIATLRWVQVQGSQEFHNICWESRMGGFQEGGFQIVERAVFSSRGHLLLQGNSYLKSTPRLLLRRRV